MILRSIFNPTLVLVAVLARTAGAQILPPAGGRGVADLPSRSLNPPIFYVDTSPSLGDSTGAGVRITVSVPYNQLNFTKRQGGGYEASFDVVAIFYDKKHRQVAGDLWRHRVTVDRYRDTSSQRKTFSDAEEFRIKPGQYTLEVRLSSVGPASGSSVSRLVEVAPPSTQTIVLSALEVGTCSDSLTGAVDPAGAGFTPSLTRRFGDPLPHVCARGEVLARGAAAGESLALGLRILGLRDRVEADETISLAVRGPRTSFAVGLPIAALGPGTYKLELAARWAGERALAERSFEIDASRIDIERNWDDFVELARYYLGDAAVDPLREVPEAERRARWEAFWKELDADPGTPENEKLAEFLERVRVAADRYAARGQPGWRADRGKVYIRYGEPDDVEQVPSGFNSPAYEIWRYVNKNLTFVFADSSGFGDYVLVQPSGPPF
jgi:GWxTD domain-containing protein